MAAVAVDFKVLLAPQPFGAEAKAKPPGSKVSFQSSQPMFQVRQKPSPLLSLDNLFLRTRNAPPQAVCLQLLTLPARPCLAATPVPH